jgi:Fe-S cluster biosynthesis and repair protein YggX
MSQLTCARCGREGPQMPFRPFQTELGLRIFNEICNGCWGEWLKLQQQLINHYGMNLRDPEAKKFLTTQMEQFLFPVTPAT